MPEWLKAILARPTASIPDPSEPPATPDRSGSVADEPPPRPAGDDSGEP